MKNAHVFVRYFKMHRQQSKHCLYVGRTGKFKIKSGLALTQRYALLMSTAVINEI